MRVLQWIAMYRVMLAYVAVGVCLMGGIWWALKPRKIHFLFDTVLASDIKDAIALRYTDVPMSAAALREKLKKESPAISDITLQRTPQKIARAHIFAERPHLHIQSPLTNYALTKKGTVCPLADFNPYYLEGLPQIAIGSDMVLEHFKSDIVWQKLIRINPVLFESYKVTFTDPTHIGLTSKKHTHLLIVADMQTIDNMQRIDAAEKIYNQKKGDSLKKGLKFDIRLHDAIVCAPLKAGEL